MSEFIKKDERKFIKHFFFKISFIKVFNFNLNTFIIKLNRLIINSLDNKLMIILIYFEL